MSHAYPMLDIENVANVARFLQSVQPLRGCEYGNDDRFRHGDRLIREFIATVVLGKDAPSLSIKDAADVLRLMHNIEPLDGEIIFDGSKTHCGYVQILEWVERSLLGARKRGAR